MKDSDSLTILNTDSGELRKHLQFDRHNIQGPVVQGDKVDLYDITGVVQHLTTLDSTNHW